MGLRLVLTLRWPNDGEYLRTVSLLPLLNPMKALELRLETLLLSAIALMLICPLALTLLTKCVPSSRSWTPWLDHPWLGNKTLDGVNAPPGPIPLSWSAIKSGEYQARLANGFNLDFAGREFVIRTTNELNYRLFRVSSSKTISVVFGKDDWLFDERVLREYSFYRSSEKELEPTVIKLAQLQESCRQRGIAFAVLISPSKASIYPEKIPEVWKIRYDPRPRAYAYYKQLLEAHGVRYIDGPDLTRRAKASSPVPVFPQGGIHWSEYACLISTNELLKCLQQENRAFQSIDFENLQISQKPGGTDADIYSLTNLAFPWSYPVAKVIVRPIVQPVEGNRPNLVFVGGSFIWQVMSQISHSRQCQEVDGFYYYDRYKKSYVDGEVVEVISPIEKVDFSREVFGADALIYEVNESTIAVNNNGQRFLQDALNYLAQAPLQKAPFSYAKWRPYRWGEKISLQANVNNRTRGFLRGFFEPESTYIWTQGSEAVIQLAGSRTTNDLILEGEVGAMLPPKGRPQSATIWANNHQVGEWLFNSPGIQKQQVRISRELITDGNLTLRFQISHPTSPRALGLSNDERELGMLISSLQLYAAHPSVLSGPDGEGFFSYRWGEEISFRAESSNLIAQKYLSGFWEAESKASWTDGANAALRLTLPSTERDLVLEAEVGGFVPSGRPNQQAIIYVNEKRAGSWSFSSAQPVLCQLAIPHALIGNEGRVVIRFEILYPGSPAETGQGDDARKLGLNFVKLQLRPSGSSLANLSPP
jgi:alginate O-acetyltransferase complex protein AlgJ